MSSHEFVDWPGFFKQEKYCKHCGDWESDANPFRCKTREETLSSTSSVSNLAAQDAGEYPYVLSTLLTTYGPHECNHLEWNGYVAFSSWDDITILEFEDGVQETPNGIRIIADLSGIPCNQLGLSFRFKRIRESWKDKYKFTADEYYDDLPATRTVSASSSTGAGYGNSATGNTSGSQHGNASSSRLGTMK